MSVRSMATVLKRLPTLCVALAFLIGATIGLLPCGMAPTDIGIRADMSAGSSGSTAPCTGHTPTCIDHVGCVTLSALPISPVSPPIAFRWTSVAYDFAAEPLAGRSVEPELAPPILAA